MNKIISFAVIAFVLIGCKKPPEEEFDRGAMLDNMASAVIIPAYEDANTAFTDLHTAATQFTLDPDTAELEDLQSKFLIAYTKFQRVKPFEFGPASDLGIKASFNTYPTDGALISSNISSGSYTIGSVGNITAEGLPAIDYLLYNSTFDNVLTAFSFAPNFENRRTYLTELTLKMKNEMKYVRDQWVDSYKSEFIAANGTDVGSSASLLFNEFVKDIELLKNAKIGIPAGQFSGGEPLEEMVEAYYSGHSKSLALESLEGLRTTYRGGAGIGFDDYIIDVEGEDVTVSLNDNINNQFAVIKTKIEALGDPFSTDIPTNFTGFNEAFLEIKKLVTYTKTDMASVLGLLITFSDSDGD